MHRLLFPMQYYRSGSQYYQKLARKISDNQETTSPEDDILLRSCPKVEVYFDDTVVNQEKATLGHAEGRLLIAGANSLVRVGVLLKQKL
ncbi:hypothetical protein M0R45_016376 [Rubus argutus]|uniref:Uncharacterized protein n=1 Tax=Rubus argutus TaxID=59490 RepID=A0AAW1XSB8_RUBAR